MAIDIIQQRFFACQVCATEGTSDEEIETFVTSQLITDTGVWKIVQTGDDVLDGTEGRVTCDKHPDHFHVVLELR